MISVLSCKDEKTVKELYEKSGIIVENGECVIAKNGEEIIGYCLFEIKKDAVYIHDISPAQDILLADGILRSALHVASQRFIFKAYYDNDSIKEVIKKTGFIKDESAREIDIDKLFRGCGRA